MQIKKIFSESDNLLLSWGYDLWDEYVKIINFANIPNNSIILEFGTGSGRALTILNQLGYNVVSIDYDGTQIAKAKAKLDEINANNYIIIQNNFFDLNIPENSVEFIICGNVLHETEQAKELLFLMLRLLKRGGNLLLWDFNNKGFEIMNKLHNVIYKNNHNEGNLRINDVLEIIAKDSFVIKKFYTELNEVLLIERV